MIVEIKNNKTAAKIDATGAQLISFRDLSGTEYIWQRNPAVWKNCSPILFPIVGNCRNDQTIIQGKTCSIPKHGPCKTTEFHLKHQTEASVSFEITHEDFSEPGYPYPFHLIVSYELNGESLSLILEVRNPSSAPISYCIGLHPGIRCPLLEGERFEDYVLRFSQKQTYGYRRYDTQQLQFDMSEEYPCPGDGVSIPLTHDLFLHDAIWFDRPASKEVSLLNPSTGHGLSASFEDYETVAFWTGTQDEAEFVCIEPWNGSAICSDEDDDFQHKNHLQHLSPGASKTYTMQLKVL